MPLLFAYGINRFSHDVATLTVLNFLTVYFTDCLQGANCFSNYQINCQNNEFLSSFLSFSLFSDFVFISVTNPIDVVKIRMQLENEMREQKGLSHMKGRYYNGLLVGVAKIVKDEGIRGLYKGYVYFFLCESL